MSNIKPLNDRVLLERIEASDKTAGGILLPDSAKEKPTEGRIVAVGEGKVRDNGTRVPLAVKVGNRVLFSSYAGTQIKEGGKEYLILEASEILAVVDDAPFGKGAAASKKAASKEAKPAADAKKKANKKSKK
jgi:chaperonin GroES